ncbi:hypothetical protein N579_07545 [Corynebacterium pseudodiphtheriticum 090104]|nr:hypothetical protein N579_07545 [Corynebacterium pseudodiphtheriticum 090104]
MIVGKSVSLKVRISIITPPFIKTTVVTLHGKNLVLACVHGLNILDRPAMYQAKPIYDKQMVNTKFRLPNYA